MFNAPSAVRAPSSEASYIQPTLNHGLRIWWAYYWPTAIAAGLLEFCTAYWLRFLYDRAEISARVFRDSLLVVPYVSTAIVGILIFRYLLGKRFRHFRLALLSSSVDSAAPLRPVWRRTVRVWWTFTWRSVIYGLVLGFLASISLGIFLRMLAESSRLLAVLVPLIQGLIINAAVGLFVIYSNILDEEFGDFRVVLLPRESPIHAPVTPSTPPQIAPTV